MTTQQAADLLGVRTATVYAYVSRGILRHAPGGSRAAGSRFLRSDVSRLVQDRRRPRAGTFEVAVETAITRIDPAGALSYRGHDVARLARTSRYEAVAELLWGSEDFREPWPVPPVRVDPRPTAPAERMRYALLEAGRGPSGADAGPDVVIADALSPDAFRVAARRATGWAISALPLLGDDSGGVVAERLWPRLTAAPADAQRLRALDAALIVLADHELATSTVVARATAGTWADPYHVLLAGSAALAGGAHGAASAAAYDILTDQRSAVGIPPGFGHLVYADTDPRFDVIIDLLEPWAPQVVEAVDHAVVAVRRAHGAAPNVDFALGALCVAAQADRRCGEAIFLLARLAGFTAHAIEEQGMPLRFRARADYVGEPTGGPT